MVMQRGRASRVWAGRAPESIKYILYFSRRLLHGRSLSRVEERARICRLHIKVWSRNAGR
jgi:hypothetical protein